MTTCRAFCTVEWCIYIYIYMNNFHFISFLLKSLAVVSIWLALSSVLYSRIALFPPKSHLLPSLWGCNNKTKQPIRFPGVLTVTKQIVGNLKAKKPVCGQFCNFKILVLVKILLLGDWILWFQNGCYTVVIELSEILVWFRNKLALRARSSGKSRVWLELV